MCHQIRYYVCYWSIVSIPQQSVLQEFTCRQTGPPLSPRYIHSQDHVSSSTSPSSRVFGCRLGWRHGYPAINDRVHCYAQQRSNRVEKSTSTHGDTVDNGIGIYDSHRGHEGVEMD